MLVAGGVALYALSRNGGSSSGGSSNGPTPAPAPRPTPDPTPTTHPDFDASCTCGQGSGCEILPGLDRIGYGFDAVAGDLDHGTRHQVVSFVGCTNKYGHYLVPDAVQVTSEPSTVSSFHNSVVRSAQQKADSLAVSAGLSVHAGFFSLSASVSETKRTFESGSDYYAEASVSALRTSYRAELKDNAVRTDSFASAVAALPEDFGAPGAAGQYRQFVREHGTHVFVSATFGGTGTMMSKTKRSSHKYESDASIKAAMRAHFLFVSASASVASSDKWISESANAETDTVVHMRGGNASLPRVGNPDDWNKWVASVDANPAILMSPDFRIRLASIDEFMTDASEAVRNNTRAAVQQYAAEYNNLHDPKCYTENKPQVCGGGCCGPDDLCCGGSCRPGGGGASCCGSDACSASERCCGTTCAPKIFSGYQLSEPKEITGKFPGHKELVFERGYNFCFFTAVQHIYKDDEHCEIRDRGDGTWSLFATSQQEVFQCKAQCVKWPQGLGPIADNSGDFDNQGHGPRTTAIAHNGGENVAVLTALRYQYNWNRCTVDLSMTLYAWNDGDDEFWCGARSVSLEGSGVHRTDTYDTSHMDGSGPYPLGVSAGKGFCFLTDVGNVGHVHNWCRITVDSGQYVLHANFEDDVSAGSACAASCVHDTC